MRTGNGTGATSDAPAGADTVTTAARGRCRAASGDRAEVLGFLR